MISPKDESNEEARLEAELEAADAKLRELAGFKPVSQEFDFLRPRSRTEIVLTRIWYTILTVGGLWAVKSCVEVGIRERKLEDQMVACLKLNRPELYQPCLDAVYPPWRKELQQGWREDAMNDPAWAERIRRAR